MPFGIIGQQVEIYYLHVDNPIVIYNICTLKYMYTTCTHTFLNYNSKYLFVSHV